MPAVCDRSLGREQHGAKIDCGLLAAVYLELIGGRQPGLDFVVPAAAGVAAIRDRPCRRARMPLRPTELAAHQAMLALLTAPLWLAEA